MRIRKIHAGAFIAACCVMIAVMHWMASGNARTEKSPSGSLAIFENERAYLRHIETKVRFRNITLSIVEVQRGDNFWKIARRYHIDIDTLIGANPFWDTLVAGMKQYIVVPSSKGVLHFVADTGEIDELARRYGVGREMIEIQSLPRLYRFYSPFIGDGGPIAVFIRNVRPRCDQMTDALSRQFALREMFRSPLGGRYSSYYGSRVHPIFQNRGFHNGVDIAAPQGTPVSASRAGVVTAAGWMGGYGKAVVIEHGDGFKTLYGHLSQIGVSSGQRVAAGRFIGRVGSTGYSTGPHLHFTLWHNEKLLNPMKVLW